MRADLDPDRFTVERGPGAGVEIAYVRAGHGGVPLVCVHGWPESKRLYWRVIEPLADAGFDVVVPDLRGFGDSGVAEDFHDVASHALDLLSLVDHLGLERPVWCGGDLGGPVIQDVSLRAPDRCDRLVLFNSPLAFSKELMAHLPDTRAPREAADYFLRQGTDPDALAAELTTADQRHRYIATFYTSRFWAHPGTFDEEAVAFHVEPFGDAARLRASFGGYESTFSEAARREPGRMASPNPTPTCLLFGPSDHVLYPAFDRMAAAAFPNHVGPFLLRDCGHFVPWEAPHQLVGAIRSFCADLTGRRPA
ncbi:MAG: alpha/beta hydrolase [Actinomycetota bacterium]